MSERRLAAIMFTDMVGYSALAQRNEELALELLDEHRGMLRPVFAGHGGRVIDTAGDGFLVEFASALAAVRCAIDAQRALGGRNAMAPPERAIRIRIGMHLGDVVFSEGDVYGDGVNIAARLEPFAEPGGICLSQQVYDQVHGKLDVPLVTMGRPRLKNIGTPIEVYALYLSAMGRFDQALMEIDRAQELDPLSAAIGGNVAAILFSARRYDEALTAVRQALAMNPEFRTSSMYLGIILLLTGAYAEALAALRRADEPARGASVMTSAMLGYAYAKLGDNGHATQIAAALADRYHRAYASPVWIAFLYQGLGDRPQALQWLDRACRDRDGWLRLLRTSPFFDDIRETPEYRRVLTTVGLPDPGPEDSVA
jgi:class 3 adenylate cyclase